MSAFNSGTNSLYADTLYWSGATSTTYPVDPDFTRNANFGLELCEAYIQRADATWLWDDSNNTDLPIATTDLTSGQSDYALTISHRKIQRVRVKDSNGNWITLQPIIRRQLSDSQLNADGTPKYYYKLGRSIFLISTPNYSQTGGLEVQFQRGSSYFVVGDTTKTPGFAPQFHRLISLYAALDFTDANEMESRSQKIHARIGEFPDEVNGIAGSGMLKELSDFYSTRDDDQAPSVNLRTEDYGSSAMGYYGTFGDNNPKGF